MILTIFLVILNVNKKNKSHRKVFNLKFKMILRFLMKTIFKKLSDLRDLMKRQKSI